VAVATHPAPRPFREILGMWPDMLQMNREFFAREATRANTANAYLGMMIMVVVGAFLSQISMYLYGLAPGLGVDFMRANPETAGDLMTMSLGWWVLGRVIGIVLFNGLIFLLARLLGGKGRFGRQFYVQSLFQAPIGILITFATLAGGIGIIGALTLVVVTVMLNSRALQGVHGLSPVRANIASLVPALLIFGLVVFGAIALMGMAAATAPV